MGTGQSANAKPVITKLCYRWHPASLSMTWSQRKSVCLCLRTAHTAGLSFLRVFLVQGRLQCKTSDNEALS